MLSFTMLHSAPANNPHPPLWHHTAKPSGIETTDKYDYCLHEATDASKDKVNFHSSGADAFAMEDDLGTAWGLVFKGKLNPES